jgi:hypothetical protein
MFDVQHITVHHLRLLGNLRSVEKLAVTVHESHSFDGDQNSCDFLKVESPNLWTIAFSVWQQFQAANGHSCCSDAHPKFQVIVKFSPKCKPLKQFVAQNMSSVLSSVLNWDADIGNNDFEVCVHIRPPLLLVGIHLQTAATIRANSSLGTERQQSVTCLKENIAFSLLQTANVQNLEVVVDPMCGGGTIMEVGAHSFPQAFFIAGDSSFTAVQKSAWNLTGVQLDVHDFKTHGGATGDLRQDSAADERSRVVTFEASTKPATTVVTDVALGATSISRPPRLPHVDVVWWDARRLPLRR